jgi:transketolase
MVILFLIQYFSGKHKKFQKNWKHNCWASKIQQNMGKEFTTGPLGKGVANDVVMAVSCKKFSAMFNANNQKIIDNNVLCLWNNGYLQEGFQSKLARSPVIGNLIT